MLPSSHIPKHVAIIMDGNGRWATSKGYGRTWGHREGAKRVDEIVTAACEFGIRYLTLYAFSSENWNRPQFEVSTLMRLLVHHLRTMDKKLLRNRVSLSTMGNTEKLPPFVRTELARVTRQTHLDSPKLSLCLALSYGGRQEITECAKAWARKIQAGEASIEDLDESSFGRFLYRPDFPDPDLLVRTGGESRVSNFLLWQVAYSEIVITPELWPEFGPESLRQCLEHYSKRERRFGKTSAQVSSEFQTSEKAQHL